MTLTSLYLKLQNLSPPQIPFHLKNKLRIQLHQRENYHPIITLAKSNLVSQLDLQSK
jgi:hypothetical protein